MTVALYLPSQDNTDWWVKLMQGLLPDWDIVSMDAVTDPATVRYVVVWRPRTGDIARFANLKAIVSVGAGIDHVLADVELPESVPIIRTVGQDLTQRMQEYVALHVLRHHRDMPLAQPPRSRARDGARQQKSGQAEHDLKKPVAEKTIKHAQPSEHD